MLSTATLDAYSGNVVALGQAAESYVAGVLDEARATGAGVEEMRDLAIEAILAAADEFGGMSRELACELYEGQTGASATFGGAGPERAQVEKSVRYLAGTLADGSEDGAERFVRACATKAAYYARRGANEAVMGSCARASRAGGRGRATRSASTRFARVPRGGDTCTFCAMLASRGFVYWSRKTAGEFNHYHDHCRCLVVPDDGSGEVEGYDPGEWQARWDAYEEIDARDDLTRGQKDALKRSYGTDLPLRTRADPALEYFGPAEEDDPEALARIKADLAASGVEIVVSPRGAGEEGISYGPSGTRGTPGNMHVTEGMSLSAWLHEYTHFCQDRDRGYPSFGYYLANKELRVSMEEEAYGVEIAMARSHGYNELEEKLKALLEAERGRLNGK